ncbi:hypothetical protein LIER_26805 [Lithospermum erythrorhizon]|uniref:RNase H type-1 domain-containing protein n=1 Tax=Lithospermum erythrorhizon TaxID=34254 RepID=A0AAV3RBS0_LITER
MNWQLTRVVTCEEVKRAVFEMPANKFLGPDGMTYHGWHYRPRNDPGKRFYDNFKPEPHVTEETAQPFLLHGTEHSWRPPASNLVKVNCDAGWRKEHRSGSIGAVIRDEMGHFIGELCKQI